MTKDSLFTMKLQSGEIVRVGDVGKTVVRPHPQDNDPDNYEPFFFYGRTVDTSTAGYIGEINDIQVEPNARPTDENVKAGQTIVYNSGDLL